MFRPRHEFNTVTYKLCIVKFDIVLSASWNTLDVLASTHLNYGF